MLPDVVIEQLETLNWLQIGVGGRLTQISPNLAKMLGYKETQMHGKEFRDLFADNERDSELPEAQSILTANQSHLNCMANWLRKDGSLVPVSLVYKRLSGNEKEKENDKDKQKDKEKMIGKDPFSVPMLLVVFAREQGTVPSDIQGRLDMALWERERLKYKYALDHQMRLPLAVMSLSINLLRDHAERMSPSEREAEVRKISESLMSCKMILERAGGDGNVGQIEVQTTQKITPIRTKGKNS